MVLPDGEQTGVVYGEVTLELESRHPSLWKTLYRAKA